MDNTYKKIQVLTTAVGFVQMFVGNEPATPRVRTLGAGSQAEHGEGEQEELKQGP